MLVQHSSTSCAVLSCTGCYFRRVPEAPCRIGRALGAESPASPTTTVFDIRLLCTSCATELRRDLAYVFVTISSHIVGCCRTSWAHVVRCFMRSCAAQSSMMHAEGSTELKIGYRLASTSCCTALYQPIPRDDVQLLEVSTPRTTHTQELNEYSGLTLTGSDPS